MTRAALGKIAGTLATSVIDTFKNFQLIIEYFVAVSQPGTFAKPFG
jgi:hypothetical protein